jgi:hypothetical protein
MHRIKKCIGTRGAGHVMARQMAEAKRSRRVKEGVFAAWRGLLRTPPSSPSLALRAKSRALRAFVGQWRMRVAISRKVGITPARHTSHVTRHTLHVTLFFVRCMHCSHQPPAAAVHLLSKFPPEIPL